MVATPDVLFTADTIAQRVRELASTIAKDYASDDTIHLVATLRGCFIFLADLTRALSGRRGGVTVDFIAVSSYGRTASTTGEITLLKDLEENIDGRHVILVDDIVDTGLTLAYLQDLVRTRSPRSLRTVCLLNKPSRRRVHVEVEYIGFTIADRFVVGYGLDYAQMFRGLPYIAVLDPPPPRAPDLKGGDRTASPSVYVPATASV